MLVNYSLYLIMDDSLCAPDAMPHMLTSLLNSGITCVQLRMKKSSSQTIIKTASILKEILSHQSIPLIINDSVEIAKWVNADGVHLGQTDLHIYDARQYLGNNKIIGLSIENYSQAQTCKTYPVDYFGVGPIFSTTTKKDAAQAMGVNELNTIIHILTKPIVAIGGINSNNVKTILKTGVAGVALASHILSSPNPTSTAEKMAALLAMEKNS